MPDRNVEQNQSLKTAEDPKEFMEAFYASKFYKDAYEDFFKGKNLVSDITEEEKREAFLKSEKAKFALVDFGVLDTHLEYNSSLYPVGSQQALSVYVDSVDDMYKMMREKRTSEEIEALDELRFLYHGVAAEQLVKDGIAPSVKLGRAFCRLILIGKGLDTPDNAREPDLTRARRKMGLV